LGLPDAARWEVESCLMPRTTVESWVLPRSASASFTSSSCDDSTSNSSVLASLNLIERMGRFRPSHGSRVILVNPAAIRSLSNSNCFVADTGFTIMKRLPSDVSHSYQNFSLPFIHRGVTVVEWRGLLMREG